MSVHLDELVSSKKVLLLQGPMGDFFAQLADWLMLQGVEVYKINFNGGDWFYYHARKNIFHFRQRASDFSGWIQQFVEQHQIDSMVCFGDCRKYHRIANRVAIKHNIKFFAFEEGYIRPNYITFEQDGVNFFSNFAEHLKQTHVSNTINDLDTFREVDNNYPKMLRSAFLYYLMWSCALILYPYYYHHRCMSPLIELYCWLLSAWRRLKNAFSEEKRFSYFLTQQKKNYFVFALQVHNDFQIRVHSDLKRMESYIEQVIQSFSLNAEKNRHLVLKHHPMDRGYRNYQRLIQQCAEQHGVVGRVHYFCDIHLPSLLKESLGMVTVNSTTGIQALFHGIPVKVLGRALYDLPRLTNQYPLSQFWSAQGTVDKTYFNHFRHELIEFSQLNGSYYGLSPWMTYYQSPVSDIGITTKESMKV
ncbi:capsular biosynthesis protein [Acinetobacter sp. MD2]|uniref:capsule biosynthesis protein n=1 Tax=Acinetobacter sp. MD2 TaxID=2600066 RepID=UPI002D1E9832|nr:capsular biosynthesis protein [Acinetobacter sp. MD2]MEB3767534.1 capsular biosynthesis protein [Acinetobacter sp. MD2]